MTDSSPLVVPVSVGGNAKTACNEKLARRTKRMDLVHIDDPLFGFHR